MTEDEKREIIETMTRAFCGDDHLACSFPDCSCVTTPPKALAAFTAIEPQIWGIFQREKNRAINERIDRTRESIG